MRFPNYEDLVRLWYGPETRGQIARRYGVSERAIIVEWHGCAPRESCRAA